MKVWIKPAHKIDFIFERILTWGWIIITGFLAWVFLHFSPNLFDALFWFMIMVGMSALGFFHLKEIKWVEKEDDRAAIEIKIKDDQGREINNPELIKAIAEAVAKKVSDL